MAVPFADLRPTGELRAELERAMASVLDSGQFILGDEVAHLERELAALSGADVGVGVSSGSDAVLASLWAEGVGPGDRVITTPFTFFATAGAIARLGAEPVFVDIEPRHFHLDLQRVGEVLDERVRAVLPVHLFGRRLPNDALVHARRELDQRAARPLAWIEDAAQAVGASSEPSSPTDVGARSPGIVGDAFCLSFFPTKTLGAFGDGGMVLTNDAERAERLRRLRSHGAKPKYFHPSLGGNFRLDALQAAVLRVKLRYLPQAIARRRELARGYRERFLARGFEIELAAGSEGVGPDAPLACPDDEPGHAYACFVVRAHRRDELRQQLQSRQLGSEVYYPTPLHLQPCFSSLGYREGDLPRAERAAREALALPLYPGLSDDALDQVVDTVAEFYRR